MYFKSPTVHVVNGAKTTVRLNFHEQPDARELSKGDNIGIKSLDIKSCARDRSRPTPYIAKYRVAHRNGEKPREV